MRILADDLTAAENATVRRPDYKILAYDPNYDTMSDVVCGTASQEPFDLTPYCTQIKWTPTKLDFTLSDPEGIFHPDSGLQKNYLADAAIIRFKEGGETVPETSWVWTFTGFIRGQIGWQKTRKSGTMVAQVTVYSRENSQALKRRKITSKQYTKGTELGTMLGDILSTFLGLSAAENAIPSVLGLQLRHSVNQISQMAPWEAIEKILEAVGKIPCFDGAGRITYIDQNMNRLPNKIMSSSDRIYDYQIPALTQDTYNKVRVVFLGSELEEVESEYQCLGTAQVTTGFFSMHESLEVWWSEDHKQRAKDTTMIVKKSVNSGLLPVGTESYKEIDQFHGQIDVAISVWVPLLATAMLAEYLLLAAKPDKTTSKSTNLAPTTLTAPGEINLVAPPAGGPVTGTILIAPAKINVSEVPATGWTIPWGRIAQAQASVGIMLIMMSIGSAQYEIWGTPFDMAYVEKESVAIQDGLNYWDENELKIENDFLGSYEQADALAVIALTWEVSKSKPRKLVIDDDLALERGDILQLPDGRKLLISDMSKTIKRGEAIPLTLEGFKVMTA